MILPDPLLKAPLRRLDPHVHHVRRRRGRPIRVAEHERRVELLAAALAECPGGGKREDTGIILNPIDI